MHAGVSWRASHAHNLRVCMRSITNSRLLFSSGSSRPCRPNSAAWMFEFSSQSSTSARSTCRVLILNPCRSPVRIASRTSDLIAQQTTRDNPSDSRNDQAIFCTDRRPPKASTSDSSSGTSGSTDLTTEFSYGRRPSGKK